MTVDDDFDRAILYLPRTASDVDVAHFEGLMARDTRITVQRFPAVPFDRLAHEPVQAWAEARMPGATDDSPAMAVVDGSTGEWTDAEMRYLVQAAFHNGATAVLFFPPQ